VSVSVLVSVRQRKGYSVELNVFDIGVFLTFPGVVVAFGMIKSRKEKTSKDYFLANRGLKWWLIGSDASRQSFT
jgi:hypothetical protein